MVEHSAVALDETFAALANPTRRSLLQRLAAGEASVTELAGHYPISLAAVSKHLQVLERAGLVQRRRQGRVHHLSIQAQPMLDAARWLVYFHRFWEISLDALEALIADEQA